MGFSLSLLLFILQAVQAAQYYVKQADLLVDISLVHNSSSNGVDFHISMASHFGRKGGWKALGTGHGMKGSLMFIMSPDNENAISLSVRTAHGHGQPKTNPELPPVSVFNSVNTETDGSKVEFVCYSCDRWPGVDVTDSAQQFIWARRDTEVTSKTNLGIHSDIGFLEIDMELAFTGLVEQSNSIPTTNFDTNDTEPNVWLQYILTLHGVVLGASFMALYPIGALLIHHGNFKNSFAYHWIVQLSLTVAGFTSVILGLLCSQKGTKFRNFFGTHQILGTVIFCCMIMQILMGYLHHLNYLRYLRRTWVSYGHIWLGKLILLLGVLNTRLGLEYSGAGKKTLLLWWVCLGIYVFCLICIMARRTVNTKEKGTGGVYTLLNA